MRNLVLLILLFSLLGLCPVFDLAVFLWMLMSNFRINVLEIVQVVCRYLVFHFLRFLQAGHRPSCLHGLFMLWF
jgi:hypothetical protein